MLLLHALAACKLVRVCHARTLESSLDFDNAFVVIASCCEPPIFALLLCSTDVCSYAA